MLLAFPMVKEAPMPRHPRPAALRANTERRDVGLVPIEGRRPVAPPPPPGLLVASKATWARFWSSPLAQIVVPDTDLSALTRLWSLYDERTRMYRAITRERVVRGSKGQPRANPLYAQMSALDSAIERLEDRFGLSPRARLTLGVILGDAARSLADLNADLESDEDLDDLLDDPVVVDG
jgi:P27 family predicted phage terminase small subunit